MEDIQTIIINHKERITMINNTNELRITITIITIIIKLMMIIVMMIIIIKLLIIKLLLLLLLLLIIIIIIIMQHSGRGVRYLAPSSKIGTFSQTPVYIYIYIYIYTYVP